MNVDNLHRFYGTELDIELSLKLNISKSTVSKWRSFGIPPERQAVFQVLSKNALEAALSNFEDQQQEVAHG